NAAKAGQTQIFVTNTVGLRKDIWLGVGLGTSGIELHRIESISGNTITLTEPLVRAHAAGEAAGVEFVRYAYYADVLLGPVFVHDHVNGIDRWQRGLVGTIIVEPKGSTYHDPKTGEKVRNATIADIHTSSPVCYGCEGKSFREVMLISGDWRTAEIGDTKAWFNLRSEPFANRGGDPSLYLSSVTHGDPSTPLLRAYEGDQVMVRFLNASPTTIMRTVRVAGQRFHLEYGDDIETAVYDSIQHGVSEKFDAVLEGGAGKAGDYLYYDTQAQYFEGGGWGIVRVHDARQSDLKPLGGGASSESGAGFPSLTHTGGRPPEPLDIGNPCPEGAPARTFDVHAVQANLVYNQKAGLAGAGKVFVLAEDAAAAMSGAKRPEPLVLRAAAGDCVTVNLTNRLAERVSFHMGKAKADPQSLGITVGYNYDQSVAPGRTRSYQYYVDPEVGSAIIADFAQLNALAGTKAGLYGALVTAAEGSRFLDPSSGQPIKAGTRAIVANDDPSIPSYRDYALLFHESDETIGTNDMPYRRNVLGLTAINYKTAPLSARMNAGAPVAGGSSSGKGSGGSSGAGTVSLAGVLSSSVFGDPETPLLEAYEGDAVRVHVLQGYGFQTGTFALNGHAWPYDPNLPGSEIQAVHRFGPHQEIDIVLDGGARMPGDYLYENHRLAYMEAGQWGIFRVHASPTPALLPLTPAGTPAEPGQEEPTATPTPSDPANGSSGTGSGGSGTSSSNSGSGSGSAPSGGQGSSSGGSSLGSGSAPTSPAASVLQPLFRLLCLVDVLQCVLVESPSNSDGGAGEVQTPADSGGAGETSGGPSEESVSGDQEPRFRLVCRKDTSICS
ncbi:MAG: multicopper oxidase domain-containing protein, partial [Chloroflexi bacterium]|nr:multicopper oxidase domain-containing protein [Chloroflexota bacterium]